MRTSPSVASAPPLPPPPLPLPPPPLPVECTDDDLTSVGHTLQRSERSKSESMMWPSSRTSTFSGLRSLYTIPSMCRYSMASSTSAT